MTKQKAPKVETKIHNHTNLTLDQIEAMELVGMIRNNWRGRMVCLYSSGDGDPTMLYMVGKSFDLSMYVVSYEPQGKNESIAIDYWKHGKKIYTRD